MIMSLRKILGLRTAAEKLSEYQKLKEQLAELDKRGKDLAERYTLQKSIVDEIDILPESKKSEILERHKEFVTQHQADVTDAINKRNKILKSLKKYREDKEIRVACVDIDTLDVARLRYLSGKMNKDLYFDIVKSTTGEPTKYADVVAENSKGQICILHRVEDYVPTGMVCVPGGHVDPGEDFQTAAIRELKEETNLDPLPGTEIVELGEYKTDDAHIKYFKVYVDDAQPVTVDATEHCFAEWIEFSEIPTKPFIFNQGENIVKVSLQPKQLEAIMPIMKALYEGRMTPEAFVPSFSGLIKKAMTTEDEKPLQPESLEGGVKKNVTFLARDPKRHVDKIMKAISGNREMTVNSELKFEQPINVCEVKYRDEPEDNQLTEVTVIFIGDNNDMESLIGNMRRGLMGGELHIKTPHEDFMAVNELGTDYVGEPVFVSL